MKKNIVVLLIALWVLAGCSSVDRGDDNNLAGNYSVTTFTTDQGIPVPIVYYVDAAGNFYYRVLPNVEVLTTDISVYEGYPVDWTLLPAPTQ